MKMKRVPVEPTIEIPEGIHCKLCGKVLAPHSIVLHERIRGFGHLVWHLECVSVMVADAEESLSSSDEEFDAISKEELDIYV